MNRLKDIVVDGWLSNTLGRSSHAVSLPPYQRDFGKEASFSKLSWIDSLIVTHAHVDHIQPKTFVRNAWDILSFDSNRVNNDGSAVTYFQAPHHGSWLADTVVVDDLEKEKLFEFDGFIDVKRLEADSFFLRQVRNLRKELSDFTTQDALQKVKAAFDKYLERLLQSFQAGLREIKFIRSHGKSYILQGANFIFKITARRLINIINRTQNNKSDDDNNSSVSEMKPDLLFNQLNVTSDEKSKYQPINKCYQSSIKICS